MRDRRPRPARRHHRVAPRASSASSRRSRSCSPGTIRDNIAFARPDATDDEVWEAVHRVGLTELIDRLPEGLDTPVHERGVSLSSGERQLIALARAFLAGPRVLVLDEATSNLDLKSETQVEAGLDAVLEGRTAIIVAHRLSTAMRADRIAVVDDGRIVELGSHDELVAAGRALRRDVRGVDRAPRSVTDDDGPEPGQMVAAPIHGVTSTHGKADPDRRLPGPRATPRTSWPTSAPSAARSTSIAATPAHTAARPSFGKKALGTTGVVRSFAIVHQAAPGVPVPYVSTVVDLDGGGQVKANIVNVEPEPDKRLARNEGAADDVCRRNRRRRHRGRRVRLRAGLSARSQALTTRGAVR